MIIGNPTHYIIQRGKPDYEQKRYIIKISKLPGIIIYILFLSSLEQRWDYGIGI